MFLSEIQLSKKVLKDNQYSLGFNPLPEDSIDLVEGGDLVKYVDSRNPEKVVSVKISNNFNNYQDGITHCNSPLGQVLLGLTKDESSTLSLPSGDVNITVKEIIKP